MERSEKTRINRTVIPERFNSLPEIRFNTYRRYRPEYFNPLPLLNLCEDILRNEPLPEPWTWTPSDVAQFIKDLGYPDYENAFLLNMIDGKGLVSLTADKLPKMNIKNLDDIKGIMKVIHQLYNIKPGSNIETNDFTIVSPRWLFLKYKGSRTGPVVSAMTGPDFYRKIKLIRDETTEDRRYYALLNHWNRINPYREWCPHVMIGNIRRINPMTGTAIRQNLTPKDHPYLLKPLAIYSVPCPDKNMKPKYNFSRSISRK